jgi:Zn-finger in ubiquitin-hydrolases and other protein
MFLQRHRAADGSPTGTPGCSHLDTIQFTDLPESIVGCEDCLASGGWWVHLRMCQSCGHIRCCDDSPSKHASAHARDFNHPVIRSAEPSEDWSYCYIDDFTFVLDR